MTFVYQLEQLALAGEDVLDIQASEFDLPWFAGNGQVFDEPIVERAVELEFQRTQAVCNPLDRIALAMGEIVCGVDFPLVARSVVMGVQNAIENRVSKIEIGAAHIYLRSQNSLAFVERSVSHLLKEIEILFKGPIAVGRILARLDERAAIGSHFFWRKVVDIGEASSNEMQGPIVELVEVVGSEE